MAKYKFHPKQFFKVPLKKIHLSKARPFPLFIYLVRNDHLLLRYDLEQETDQVQLENYAKAGLENFWCSTEFEPAWLQYLQDNPGDNGIVTTGPKQPDPPSLLDPSLVKDDLGEQTLEGKAPKKDNGEQTLEGAAAGSDKGEQTLDGKDAREDLGEQTLDGKDAREDLGEQTLDGNDHERKDNGEQTLDGKDAREDLGEQTLDGKNKKEQQEDQTLSLDPAAEKSEGGAETAAQEEARGEDEDEGYEVGPDGKKKPKDDPYAGADPDSESDEDEAEDNELASDKARSEESAAAIDILTANGISEEEKREALAEISQNMMKSLAEVNSASEEDRNAAFNKAKDFAQDIIAVLAQNHRMGKLYEDIKNISDMGSPHSSAVSAYAVIVAMGVGFTEQESLGDIAFGATLHDVGLVNIDPKILAKPEKDFTPEDIAEYQKHVTGAVAELLRKKVEFTPGVQEIIEQHHERWDGSGYPKALKGFQISELAQVVAIADYMDDLMGGRIDGKTRSPADAFDILEKLQDSDGSNKQYFAPELYESLAQIIRSTRGDAGTEGAAATIAEPPSTEEKKEAA